MSYCLLMSGGVGTRFWPISSQKKPKQYLNLVGKESLLVQTLQRFKAMQTFIVTTQDQFENVGEIKQHFKEDHIIIEPFARNTAACILLSLASLKKQGAKDSDVITISPCDHYVKDKLGFSHTLEKAKLLASGYNLLVLIGIKPHSPHTGFGYIERGQSLNESGFKISSFKEKPSLEKAKQYLEQGNFFWNSGIFVGQLKTFLQEFENCCPEIFNYYSQLEDGDNLQDIYQKIPSKSIDYAVMEKSKNVALVRAEFDWNDLGSWDSLEKVLPATNGNTLINCKDFFGSNSSGNLIYAPGKFVALNSLDDHVIVVEDETVMVIPKNKAQEVAKIVEYLKQKNRSDLL